MDAVSSRIIGGGTVTTENHDDWETGSDSSDTSGHYSTAECSALSMSTKGSLSRRRGFTRHQLLLQTSSTSPTPPPAPIISATPAPSAPANLPRSQSDLAGLARKPISTPSQPPHVPRTIYTTLPSPPTAQLFPRSRSSSSIVFAPPVHSHRYRKNSLLTLRSSATIPGPSPVLHPPNSSPPPPTHILNQPIRPSVPSISQDSSTVKDTRIRTRARTHSNPNSYSYSYTDEDSSFFARPRLITAHTAWPLSRTRKEASGGFVLRFLKMVVGPFKWCFGGGGVGTSTRYRAVEGLDWWDEEGEEGTTAEVDWVEHDDDDIDVLGTHPGDTSTGTLLSPSDADSPPPSPRVIIKGLEERIGKLEAALVVERKKRDAMAAAHMGEMKKLHRMFRETLVG
ncbi:hypothetical protein BXZ70DRAFT_142774 [Cristinia sonorae]|uniref:Uncharacterized protein n=1 Tax=Cristinia sonorae TaxID=1940300 RepID=A0A8K0URG1_9AGAR|nr:hypothetical protein BXZ70DRAFT_142774 [Cristinia sonorae]